jgi:hypothetical protein
MTSTAFSHARVEELVAAHALGGLEEEERSELLREMARHGTDCRECRTLVSEYSEAAGLLALTLQPEPVRPEEEERLILAARAQAEGTGDAEPGMVLEPAMVDHPGVASSRGPPPRLEDRAAVARLRPPRTTRWVAAVAVAASIAAIGGAVGYAVAPRTPVAESRFIAFLSRPGTRIASFPARGGESLAVAFHPGASQGWVIGSNIARPAGGRVYELWFRAGPTGPMRPAGTFVPSGGTVLSPATVGPEFDTLAVSIEPAGGSTQPTSQPVFLTTL